MLVSEIYGPMFVQDCLYISVGKIPGPTYEIGQNVDGQMYFHHKRRQLIPGVFSSFTDHLSPPKDMRRYIAQNVILL